MISKVRFSGSELEAIAKTIDLQAKKRGQQWILRCCAHDDRNPSLSLALSDSGHLLVHCFSGCDGKVVLGEIERLVPHLLPNSDQEAPVIRRRSKKGGDKEYHYRDASGAVVATKVRTEDPKRFFWRKRDKNTAAPVFNLPEVLLNRRLSEPVVIVEGEKDCESLSGLGFCSTTSPDGASATLLPEHIEPLRDQAVVLCPDRDLPGVKYLERWSDGLRNIAASVRLLWLPEAFRGRNIKDVSDLLQCDAGKEEFNRLLSSAPDCTVELLTRCMKEVSPPQSSIKFEKFSGLPEPIGWIWEPYIPKGNFTLLVGRPGIGKSSIAIDLCARASRGAVMPDGSVCKQTKVLLVEIEDAQEVTHARLLAANFDPEQVRTLHYSSPTDPLGGLRLDAEVLKEVSDRIVEEGIGLAIFSPLIEMVAVADENSAAQVRAALRPLASTCLKTGVTIIGLAHTRKSGVDFAQHRISGSHAFNGVARHILGAFDDPSDLKVKVFGPIKTNLGILGPAIPFDVNEALIQGAAGTLVKTGSLTWEPPLGLTVDEVLDSREEKPTDPEDIEGWLINLLIDAGGKLPASDVEERFRGTFEKDPSALRRAKVRGEVYSVKEGNRWYYTLSKE